ncbi:MAG: RepB family plasmid replication initiator protein [Candidatus Thorarchaeota archaeon]
MSLSNKKEVIKHSAAIQISNVVNLLQRRAWNILLANAFDDLGNKDEFEIPLRKLCSILKYDSRNDKHLKQLLRDLVDIKVEWNVLHKDNIEWGIAVLLAQAQIINGLLIYGYAPILRKRLHNPAMYAKINLSLQNKFDSKHSLALYELFVDYYNYKKEYGTTPFINVDEFRKLLGLKDNEYKVFGDLNKWVIKKAVKEINLKTDLFVTVHYKRENRKITALKFSIEKNNDNAIDMDNYIDQEIQQQKYLPLPEFEIENKELFLILTKEFGVSNNKTVAILKTMDEYYIYDVLESVRKQITENKIRDIPAFTIKALQEDYRSKKDKKSIEKELLEEKAKANIERKMEEKKNREEFEEQIKYKIEEILNNMDEDEKKLVVRKFEKEKIEDNLFLKPEYQKRGLDNVFVKAVFYEFIAETYLSKEERKYHVYAKKKDVT